MLFGRSHAVDARTKYSSSVSIRARALSMIPELLSVATVLDTPVMDETISAPTL